MRIPAIPAGLLLACLAGCGPSAGGSATLGPATDFSLRTTEGETFRLGDHLQSEVIVMSFWTSFCPSCKNELTQLQDLYEELQSSGLLVVAVALDPPETIADVRTVSQRLGFTFPVVLDEESRVAGSYNPRGTTPFTVIIDGAGRRVWAHEGFVPGDMEELEAKVRGLLAQRTGPAQGSGGAQ
jgi:peroxiredoxin